MKLSKVVKEAEEFVDGDKERLKEVVIGSLIEALCRAGYEDSEDTEKTLREVFIKQ